MRIFVCTDAHKISENTLEKALKLLPPQRREHLLPYKNRSDIINGVSAFLLLKKLLSDDFSFNSDIEFTYGKFGKPYLSGKSGIFFSISHCRCASAASVHTCEIGIDILDKRKINLSLADRICCENEVTILNTDENKEEALIKIMCLKESLSKMTGKGFTEGFKSIDTTRSVNSFFCETDDYILSLSSTDNFSANVVNIPADALFGDCF